MRRPASVVWAVSAHPRPNRNRLPFFTQRNEAHDEESSNIVRTRREDSGHPWTSENSLVPHNPRKSCALRAIKLATNAHCSYERTLTEGRTSQKGSSAQGLKQEITEPTPRRKAHMTNWKHKLAAYLHDPPSKALDIRTHGDRSDEAFRQAGFLDTEIGSYFAHADHTAAHAFSLVPRN